MSKIFIFLALFTLIAESKTTENSNSFELKSYKISYKTKDSRGKEIKASGLMVVPFSKNSAKLEEFKAIGLSVVIDCHSTIFNNKKAPTNAKSYRSRASAMLFSSKYGFVTLQPDYIGFGDAIGHNQPYMLQNLSATMVVDFFKASVKFAQEHNIPINIESGIYLTGYSHGGYVALATLPKLEELGYSINATSAMAGPYLLSLSVYRAISYNYNPFPSYLAAILYTYSNRYNIPIDSLINKPYSRYLSTLYSGKYSNKEIDKKLTPFTKELLPNKLIKGFKSSKLHRHLLENSVADFKSDSTIKFIHCRGDFIIPYKISEYTQKALKGLGTKNTELILVEDSLNTKKRYGHKECAPYAYNITAKIFSQMRLESLGY